MERTCRGYVGFGYAQAPHSLPDDPANFYGSETRCRVCRQAYMADRRAEHAGAGRGRPASRQRSSERGGRRPILDGVEQLEALVRRARYPSIPAAVAAHAVFLPVETVRQTEGRAIFPVIRDMVRRHEFGTAPDGREVLFDDNRTPTDAFLWSAGRTKGRDVQFNHIWTASKDPDLYTALWNLCATPAFLAKTTDGSNHPEVIGLLRFRSWDLYRYPVPPGEAVPARPDGYDDLRWAPMPAPIPDLEAELRSRLAANPASPAAQAGRRIGWLFSGGKPDGTI